MAEAAGLALGGVALVPLIKQTYDLCHTFRHAPEELREHAQTVQPLAQILDIVKEIVEKATSNPEGYPQWQRFLRAAGETISNTDATVKALQFMCNGNGVSSTPGKFKIRGRFQWTLKNKNKVAEYLERLSACRNDLNVILNANLVLHQWDLMDLAKRTRQTVTTSTGEMSDAASRIVADLAEIRPAMQRNNEEVSSLVGTAYMMQEMLRQIHGTIDDLRNPTVHPQKVLISVGVGTCDERGVTSSSQEMSTVEPWAGSAADSLNDDFHTGTQIASRNPNRTFASDDANVSALEGEDQKTRDFPLTLLPRIRATSTTIYAECESCRWGSCLFHRWDEASEIRQRLSALAAYWIKRVTWRSRSAYTPVTGRQLDSTSCLTIKFGQLFNHAAELSLGWSSAGSRFSIRPMCSISVSVVIPEDDKRLQVLLDASTEELQDLLIRREIHPKMSIPRRSHPGIVFLDEPLLNWYTSQMCRPNTGIFKDRTRNAMLLMAEGAKFDINGILLAQASWLDPSSAFLRHIVTTQSDLAEDDQLFMLYNIFGTLSSISSDCRDIMLDMSIANNCFSMEEFLLNASEGQFKQFLSRHRVLLNNSDTYPPFEYLLSNYYLQESEIISCLEALLSKGFGHFVFNKHTRGTYYMLNYHTGGPPYIRNYQLLMEDNFGNNQALGDVYGTYIRSSHSLIHVALLLGKRQVFEWLWRNDRSENRESFQVRRSFDGKTEERHHFSISSLAWDLGVWDWWQDVIMENGRAATDFPICSLCGFPGGEPVTPWDLLREWSVAIHEALIGRFSFGLFREQVQARAIKDCECHDIAEIDGSSKGEGGDDGEGSEGEEQDFFDVVENRSTTPDAATAFSTRGPEKASPDPAPTRTRARSI